MNRRDTLRLLLGVTIAHTLQLSPEQAMAQTADEVESLLRNAVRSNNDVLASSVLKFPREVGAELGMNVSDDTVYILRALNGQIEPELFPEALSPEKMEPMPPRLYMEDASAIAYFEKVLNQEDFDVEWYKDAGPKAAILDVELSDETAQAISRLGETTVAESIAARGGEVQAGGVAIVAAIVVVIAFGPRGSEATPMAGDVIVSPDSELEGMLMVPSIDNPYPTVGYPVVDPAWASKF
jgi:hypothetical protein